MEENKYRIILVKLKVYRVLILTVIITSLGFQSCSNGQKNNTSAQINNSLPALSQGRLATIMAQVEKMEITFYGNVPITMNVDQTGALAFMKNVNEIAVPDLSCAKAQGRMFLFGGGESIADVEFCMSDDCHYYIYYVNGEKYANLFPEENAFLLQSMLDTKIENSPMPH